jgi:quercetin dioxygenase-like cupin family protein
MIMRLRSFWPAIGLAALVPFGRGYLHAQAAAPHHGGAIISSNEGELFGRTDDGMLFKVGPVNTGSKHLFLGTLTMPPGATLPVHRRPHHEEVLFLHRGKVTFTLGARRAVIDAGTTVDVPAGTSWGIDNTGASPAVVVFIFGQPEVEQCFRKTIMHPNPQDSARIEHACPFQFAPYRE